MSMTRKDYITIGNAIKDATQPRVPCDSEIIENKIIEALIKVFQADNPNFDPQRFREFMKE